MWFSKKPDVNAADQAATGQRTTKTAGASTTTRTTKARGDAGEALALEHLQMAGLKFLTRNFETPGRGGGEIDLVMQDRDGTLVFVEVRQRASTTHGGAGASISAHKQRRIVFAARHYLMRFKTLPPCRFDVVLIQGATGAVISPTIEWLKSAFDAV